MATGYETLSEKEKQTLRLLVSGYDAKSMARHLGLSVHTINERLRDARRKMKTSSSREAARLLREAEATPQSLGDKLLGEAPARAASLADQQASPGKRARTLIPGAFVMTILFALAALSSLGGAGSAPLPSAAPVLGAEETAAADAAARWLALIDAGDWSGSYAGTSAEFHRLNTLAVWTNVSRKVRGPLGAPQGRTLVSSEWVPAPTTGIYLVKYRTRFAARDGVLETVTLRREDNALRVAGVMID